MTKSDYWNKNYRQQASNGLDSISVEKNYGSDWCLLRWLANDDPKGEILIRSREMAEHLHFMLGQLLKP